MYLDDTVLGTQSVNEAALYSATTWVVSDCTMTRVGLTHLLYEHSAQPCVTFTGHETLENVMSHIRQCAPDRIVFALSTTPGVLFSQVKWLERLLKYCPRPRVLLLSRMPVSWLPESLQNMSCSVLMEGGFRRVSSRISFNSLRVILRGWGEGIAAEHLPFFIYTGYELIPHEVQVLQLSLEGMRMSRMAEVLGGGQLKLPMVTGPVR